MNFLNLQLNIDSNWEQELSLSFNFQADIKRYTSRRRVPVSIRMNVIVRVGAGWHRITILGTLSINNSIM